MKVYISGPISGLDRRLVEKRFQLAADWLERIGHIAVNPMTIEPIPGCGCPPEALHTWACCLRKDIRQLVTCDAIYLLPNWHGSRGARLELHNALELGLEMFDAGARTGPRAVNGRTLEPAVGVADYILEERQAA